MLKKQLQQFVPENNKRQLTQYYLDLFLIVKIKRSQQKACDFLMRKVLEFAEQHSSDQKHTHPFELLVMSARLYTTNGVVKKLASN